MCWTLKCITDEWLSWALQRSKSLLAHISLDRAKCTIHTEWQGLSIPPFWPRISETNGHLIGLDQIELYNQRSPRPHHPTLYFSLFNLHHAWSLFPVWLERVVWSKGRGTKKQEVTAEYMYIQKETIQFIVELPYRVLPTKTFKYWANN